MSLNVWWGWHVLVVQSSGVVVRKKVPGLSLILGGEFPLLLFYFFSILMTVQIF